MHAYMNAPTKEIGVSLWLLERFEWNWREVCMTPLGKKWYHTGKAAALVMHDRILNSEIDSREIIPYYGKHGIR